MPAEQDAVHPHRRDEQRGGGGRTSDRHEIDDPHGLVEHRESFLERQSQQQAGEQLDTGLHDPQFLQQAAPVTVKPFGFRFMPGGLVPALIQLGTVRIHKFDNPTFVRGFMSRRDGHPWPEVPRGAA